MTKGWFSKVVMLAAGVTATLAGLATVHAQTLQLPTPPVRTYVDDHHVDLLTRTLAFSETDLTIGAPGNGGLANTRTWVADPTGGKSGFVHGYIMTLSNSGSVATVSLGGRTMTFTKSGGVYAPDLHNGWTLTQIGLTNPNWTLVSPDGTIYSLINKGHRKLLFKRQGLDELDHQAGWGNPYIFL